MLRFKSIAHCISACPYFFSCYQMILHLQKTQQIIWQAANFWLEKKEKQSLSLTLCIDQYLLITFSEAIE